MKRRRRINLGLSPSRHLVQFEADLNTAYHRVLDIQLAKTSDNCRAIYKQVRSLNNLVSRAEQEFHNLGAPSTHAKTLADLKKDAETINSRFTAACVR